MMFLVVFAAAFLSAQALILPKSSNGLHLSSRSASGLILPSSRFTMSDPDTPPEVDPTRRDPDEPGPEIPVRLPMVDFGK